MGDDGKSFIISPPFLSLIAPQNRTFLIDSPPVLPYYLVMMTALGLIFMMILITAVITIVVATAVAIIMSTMDWAEDGISNLTLREYLSKRFRKQFLDIWELRKRI